MLNIHFVFPKYYYFCGNITNRECNFISTLINNTWQVISWKFIFATFMLSVITAVQINAEYKVKVLQSSIISFLFAS